MPKINYNFFNLLLENSNASARRKTEFIYKNTTLEETLQSTAYWKLCEDNETSPVPERYHKLSSR
jgi:hypothetical protein